MKRITGGNALLDVRKILEKIDIKEEMTVADLGCGSVGFFTFAASNMVGDKGTVYAVDVLKKALLGIKHKIKQENVTNIKPIWSNLETFNATKIESESVDVSLLVNTLSQSEKRAAIIRESVRMMKKGSKLLIVEWKNTNTPFGPDIRNRVDKDSLIMAAPKLGLKYEDEVETGKFHYGLIFIKL